MIVYVELVLFDNFCLLFAKKDPYFDFLFPLKKIYITENLAYRHLNKKEKGGKIMLKYK